VAILTGILNSLLILTSLFLICLVLIQRGKGGGLAGAFGGMGGSSAFGTKAGDVFTKVTMGVAAFWILLSMLLVIIANRGGDSAWGSDSAVGSSRVAKEGAAVPGGKGKKGATIPSLPTDTAAPTDMPPAIPPPNSGSSK
jgi:preprotein translocase subunit SecG